MQPYFSKLFSCLSWILGSDGSDMKNFTCFKLYILGERTLNLFYALAFTHSKGKE